MHEAVVKIIAAAAPDKIVYVSCNPSTQARDVLMLSEDYKVAEYSRLICFLIRIMLKMLYF